MQLSVTIILVLSVSCLVIALPIDSESSARIVNGYSMDITEIPYQATLRRRVLSGWTHMCGAVTITNRAVLTAAHCVYLYDFEPSSLRVNVGTSYRLTGGKSYDVLEVMMHVAYDPTTFDYDIAMLATKSKITFGPTVTPISFASKGLELPVGTEALVSGFGTTSYEGTASPILLAAQVKILAQEVCARAYLRLNPVTTSMLCANATNPARDACQGDSGGPLVANNVLVGIVSWGEKCADSVYPGVYTKVSEFNSWIHEKLAQIY